jgi:hypothetical protein
MTSHFHLLDTSNLPSQALFKSANMASLSHFTKILGALLAALTVINGEVAFNFKAAPADNDLELVHEERADSVSVAHLGNSIQFYNDCPRLLQHMLKLRYSSVAQDSCFHGGADVTRLYEEGNTMEEKFATPAAKQADGTYDIGSANVEELLHEKAWDFIVINDHTQVPAREENRTASIQTFQDQYVPLVGDATVILLMTAAYKSPVKNSSDLGGFAHFTELLEEGYQEYAPLFPKSKIAPVGLAYKYIKDNYPQSFWEKLYAPDDLHPSPHGTYLQASVLYCTITGEHPPSVYHMSWWSTARFLDPPMEFPSDEEAEFLREVAGIMCGLQSPSEGVKVIAFLACALLIAGFALCHFLRYETVYVSDEKHEESTCANDSEDGDGNSLKLSDLL